MTLHEIPRFFLYGEPPRPARGRFVHVELLGERSRPANWTIRPHAHADLHHLFLIESGGGGAQADGVSCRFAAPCMIAAPAGVVHGFRFDAETEGRVLTFSDAFLRDLTAREPGLATLFAGGVWIEPATLHSLGGALTRLTAELGWTAPGHDLAIESHLAAALVEAMRARHATRRSAAVSPGPNAELVARYRALVEDAYRQHPSVEACAGQLGVTPGRLRAACQAVAGLSPLELLHDRLVLEAKRLMRYSNMNVAQVGAYLGFDDAAYFSRFFTRAAGASPRAFKAGAEVQPARQRRIIPMRAQDQSLSSQSD